MRQSVNNLEKGKANAELEKRNVEAKLEEEMKRHQATVAKFHADKKNILSTTEENLGVVKGKLQAQVVMYPCIVINFFADLQAKIDSEMAARGRAEEKLLEAEKKKSELTVDLSQARSHIETLCRDLEKENEKSRGLSARFEKEAEKRSQLQNELKAQSQLVTQVRNKETQLKKVRISIFSVSM